MESELITTKMTIAYAASAVLEWLKLQSWFPFATLGAARLNRASAIMIAFLSAVGIHWTFNAAEGVLVISGLTLANLFNVIWGTVQQYALQQAAYRGIIRNGRQENAHGA